MTPDTYRRLSQRYDLPPSLHGQYFKYEWSRSNQLKLVEILHLR